MQKSTKKSKSTRKKKIKQGKKKNLNTRERRINEPREGVTRCESPCPRPVKKRTTKRSKQLVFLTIHILKCSPIMLPTWWILWQFSTMMNNFEWQRRRNQRHWFGSGGQFKWIGKVLVLPWMPSFQQQRKWQIGTFSSKGANEWFAVGQVKLGVVAKEIGKVTMAKLVGWHMANLMRL